ncbi:MAG: flagellar protein FlaG [Pseudomonadales bacterium]
MERVQATLEVTTGMDARAQGRPATRAGTPGGTAAPKTAAEPAAALALDRAIDLVNRELRLDGRELAFSVDESTGKTVLRVIHAVTGEVIRQVPDEAVLAVAARLVAGESMSSLGIEAWV